MPSRYAQWMYDWEHRLTSVDNNRVVRPLDWGVEFARDWPCRNGARPGQPVDDPAKFLIDLNMICSYCENPIQRQAQLFRPPDTGGKYPSPLST